MNRLTLAAALLCATLAAAPLTARETAAEPTPESATPPASEPAAEPAAAAAPAPDAATEGASKTGQPKPRKVVSPKPSYKWVELDYGFNYDGSGDTRRSSERGLRVSTNVLLARQIYFVGAYELQSYADSLGPFTIDFDDSFLTAGLGTYFVVGTHTHGILNLTYETAKSELTFVDTSDPTNNFSAELDGDGFGALVGLRILLAPRSELAVSYKRSELEGDISDNQGGAAVDPASFEDSIDTFGVSLTAPLARAFDLVLRFEDIGVDTSQATDTDGDGVQETTEDGKSDRENFLIGLRYRF